MVAYKVTMLRINIEGNKGRILYHYQHTPLMVT